MEGSPSALTSHSLESLPGLQFSLMISLRGLTQSSGLMTHLMPGEARSKTNGNNSFIAGLMTGW